MVSLCLLLVPLVVVGCGEVAPASDSQVPDALRFFWLQAEPPAHLADRPYAVSAEAAELVLHYAELAPVWPGFEIPTEFILCTASGGTLLVLHDSPTMGASAIERPGGRRLPATLYFADERLRGLEERCATFNYTRLEGKSLLAWPEYNAHAALADPVDATASAVIHEQFHRHQFSTFGALHKGQYSITDLPADLTSAQAFRLGTAAERAVLVRALQSDASTIRENLRAYLVLRDRRMRLAPEWLPLSEAYMERFEGSAHLVGYEGLLAARGGSVDDLTRLVVRDLEMVPDFQENPEVSWYRYWHIYGTGAALGMLLDRLGIQWRQRMQEGATFVDLVREAVE